ncbi:MAG: helicase-related protein, partial [Ktedonobacteraceae bacterium]
LEKRITRLEERQEQLLKKSTTGVTFENLGLDMLLIDEAHEYKNLGLPSNIEGFQVEPSKRATDLEMKLRWLEKQGKGPFGAFFTATPLSNNMVEAYVVAWFLDQQRLLAYGLNSVDAFVANFIDISSEVEVSPDGSTFRMKSRPRSFFNIVDFLEMFAQFADIQTSDILDDKRPRREDITVAVDASPEMLDSVASLVKRADDLRAGKHTYHGDKEDNMLRIVHEGRELAVSPRQVGILTGPSPKVEAVAAKMIEIYQRWQRYPVKLPGEFNSLQIGFCDLCTPSAEKGDQVYGELKRALIDGGIPEYGIRYIHEANNDAAKAELFTQCRNGEVAILLGSTAKLGTGTNVQYRCAAIHLIAQPWRPADVEQCIGRGHRPGNRFTGMQIYRYVARKTFDAYMWQALERKSHFIHQLMGGKVTGREIDARGELELNYAEVKAAATGDPLILEQAATDMEVARLQRLAKMFF